MKRRFRYYSYESSQYVSEKECQERLGDENFEAMMKEAIEYMDQENCMECDFLKSIFSSEKSPYIDWCVEERTQQIRYAWSVFGAAVLFCVAMAIIGKFFDPAFWVLVLSGVLAVGTFVFGGIINFLGDWRMDYCLKDIGVPLMGAGALMTLSYCLLMVL